MMNLLQGWNSYWNLQLGEEKSALTLKRCEKRRNPSFSDWADTEFTVASDNKSTNGKRENRRTSILWLKEYKRTSGQ